MIHQITAALCSIRRAGRRKGAGRKCEERDQKSKDDKAGGEGRTN